MSEYDTVSRSDDSECRALLDACTPLVYVHNAFRISGLAVDATARDIKRRIDDLKHAEELGDSEVEHTHAFALDPAPTLEHIREAARRLQDPERRIIEELFWFWPNEWGGGRADHSLTALSNGDKDTAFKTWSSALSNGNGASHVVAKHNLAVMYQLVALDSEQLALEHDLTPDQHQTIAKYWRTSFNWWEDLTADEMFWSLISDRIRMMDDPRLTTGFSRRMRTTFPEALDKINAMLAVAFFEKGKLDLGRNHVTYMLETHQGLDDVPKTLAIVTKPLKTRIESSVEKARTAAQREPKKAAQGARDLLNAVAEPIKIIKMILPTTDHERIDLCDSVAETCLTCQIAFARETKDWDTSLQLLDTAKAYAASEETKGRLEENFALVKSAGAMDPLFKACEEAVKTVENDAAAGARAAQQLLSTAPAILSQLEDPDIPKEMRDRAKNEVAGTVMHCAVAFGNKTEKWAPCIALLEASLRLVASGELKDRIEANLHTVRQNQKIFGSLKPISAAPSLSTTNGIGFTLYGCTDKDAETGSYLATYYFVFFAIPIFPIRRYRVIPTTGGYRFLGKAPLRTFDKWHLFISLAAIAWFVLHMIYASNTSSSTSSSRTRSASTYPSRSSSQSVTYPQSGSSRSTLSTEIDAGKARASVLESQLQELDNRLDSMKRRMDSYSRMDMIDDYNSLVPQFNSLVNQRNAVYDEYSRTIDDVNAKVNRWNSGRY